MTRDSPGDRGREWNRGRTMMLHMELCDLYSLQSRLERKNSILIHEYGPEGLEDINRQIKDLETRLKVMHDNHNE